MAGTEQNHIIVALSPVCHRHSKYRQLFSWTAAVNTTTHFKPHLIRASLLVPPNAWKANTISTLPNDSSNWLQQRWDNKLQSHTVKNFFFLSAGFGFISAEIWERESKYRHLAPINNTEICKYTQTQPTLFEIQNCWQAIEQPSNSLSAYFSWIHALP